MGAGVVQAMARDGLLDPRPADGPTVLAAARSGAAGRRADAAAGTPRPTSSASWWRSASGVALLDGVPGAGKTEVYFEAVAAALRAGRRVLVLLPEIALSAQWLGRFERRFGTAPAVWHSAVTGAQRRRTWRLIAEGAIDVVVGARSALFLPLTDLGLIVVDEEHDGSFKQEESVHYHARDMALARARLEGCAVVLASATPSLESAMAAGIVRGGPPAEPGWRHVQLPARHGGAAMPEVRLVDLRRDRPPRGGFLSPPLREALFRNLEDGAQSLLFLNRRGYAPLTLCRACGHRLACPNCSAWLVSHRLRGRLQCHHCGYAMSAPEHCPSCGAVGLLTASGPGRRAAGRGGERHPAQGAARGHDQRHRKRHQGRDRAGPGDGVPRRRHPARHPDHRQGPPLSRPDAGGRRRRRPRPGRRRPAGGRADVPAALPGRRAAPGARSGRAGC